METPRPSRIVAVALNPAVDRVIEAPQLAIGRHQIVRTLARCAAGKAVNVARGLAALDVPCVLTGWIGHEEAAFFAQELAGSPVEVLLVPVAGRTRENITLVDPIARVETHLRDDGFEVTPGDLAALRARLAALAAPGTVCVLCGSLPRGMKPEDLGAMLALCQAAGGRAAVDASGAALAAAVAASPWLIKPNRQEFEELVGRRVADDRAIVAAGRTLAGVLPLVIVTHGARGAWLFAEGRAWHGRCEVPANHVVSTVGCGDALLAGFLAGLYKNFSLPESLRLGVAAAAATALSLTATFAAEQVAGFPRQTTVEAL